MFVSLKTSGSVLLLRTDFQGPVISKMVPACSVSKLCPTLCDPMDCSPLGSSVHGISQARILEWVAISYSRNLPKPGIEPTSLTSPALAGGFFTRCYLRKPFQRWYLLLNDLTSFQDRTEPSVKDNFLCCVFVAMSKFDFLVTQKLVNLT